MMQWFGIIDKWDPDLNLTPGGGNCVSEETVCKTPTWTNSILSFSAERFLAYLLLGGSRLCEEAEGFQSADYELHRASNTVIYVSKRNVRYLQKGLKGGIGCQIPTTPRPCQAAIPSPLHVLEYSNKQKFVISVWTTINIPPVLRNIASHCTFPLVKPHFISRGHFCTHCNPTWVRNKWLAYKKTTCSPI